MKNKKIKIKFLNLTIATLISGGVVITSCAKNEQRNDAKPKESIVKKVEEKPKNETTKKDPQSKNEKEIKDLNSKNDNLKKEEKKPNESTIEKDTNNKQQTNKISKTNPEENLVEKITINYSQYNGKKYVVDTTKFLVNFNEKAPKNLIFELTLENENQSVASFSKKVILNNLSDVQQAYFELGSLPRVGKWKIKSIKNLLNNKELISKLKDGETFFHYFKIEPTFLTKLNFANISDFNNKKYLTNNSIINLTFDKKLTSVKKIVLKLKNSINSQMQNKELPITLSEQTNNFISLSLNNFVDSGTWIIESVIDENQIFEFNNIIEEQNRSFNFVNKLPNMLNKIEFLNSITIQNEKFLTPNSQMKLFFDKEIENDYALNFTFQNLETKEKIISKYSISKDSNDSKIGFIDLNSKIKEGKWEIISINNEETISNEINQKNVLTPEQIKFNFLVNMPNIVENLTIKNPYFKNDKNYLLENSELGINFTNDLKKPTKLLIQFKDLINPKNITSQEFTLIQDSNNPKLGYINNLKEILQSGKWEIISIRDLINSKIQIEQINNLSLEKKTLEFWNAKQNTINAFQYENLATIDNVQYLIANSKINLTFDKPIEPNAKIKIQLQKLETSENIVEDYTLSVISTSEKQGFISFPKLTSEGKWKIISLQDVNHKENVKEQVNIIAENSREFNYLHQKQNFIERISVEGVIEYKNKNFFDPKTKIYIQFKDEVRKPLKLRFILQNLETQKEMIINKKVEGKYDSWKDVVFDLGKLEQEGEFKIISIKDITNGEDAKEQINLIQNFNSEFNYLKQKQNFIENFEIIDSQTMNGKTYLDSESILKFTFKNWVTREEPVKLAIKFRKEDQTEVTQEILFQADYNATKETSNYLKKINNYNGAIEIISIKDITYGNDGVEQISLIENLPDNLHYLNQKQNFAISLEISALDQSVPMENNVVMLGINDYTKFKFTFQKKLTYNQKLKIKMGFKTADNRIFYKNLLVSPVNALFNDSPFGLGKMSNWEERQMVEIISIQDITNGEESPIEQINSIKTKYI